MIFFKKTGLLTIGSRLRWLADVVTRDAAKIYELYGLDIKPKWFPVLYMLFDGSDCSVTGIAKAIGQTHPSVSNIVKELKAAGLADYEKSEDDRRATIVTLTEKGMQLKGRLRHVCEDVEKVVKGIEDESTSGLWKALDHWENALSEKSLLMRVKEVKGCLEGRDVEVVDVFTPQREDYL